MKQESAEKKQTLDDKYVSRLITKDAEFTIYMKKLKNPVYILEKLYELRQNKQLSDDEKNGEVKKIMAEYMRWFQLSEKVKHSLAINLSNQANTFRCIRANLGQFNFVAILGLEYLYKKEPNNKIPITINIDKDWNLSMEGLEDDILEDGNIYVYTDKKVTKSDE